MTSIATATGRAPRGKTDRPPKNRVGGFSSYSETSARFFVTQPLESHRGKPPAPTTTASGMRFYGYRFYSPGLGRWVNRDPILNPDFIAYNLEAIGYLVDDQQFYEWIAIGDKQHCPQIDMAKYQHINFYYNLYFDQNDKVKYNLQISSDVLIELIVRHVEEGRPFTVFNLFSKAFRRADVGLYRFLLNGQIYRYDYLGLSPPGMGSGGCTLSYDGCTDTGCSTMRYGRNVCVYDPGTGIGDIQCREKKCYCKAVRE